MSDDQAPVPATEEAAPAPAPEEAPQPIPEGDTPPAEPVTPEYVKVRYDVPRETDTPIRAVGLFWHDRSTYLIPSHQIDELLTKPGFSRA